MAIYYRSPILVSAIILALSYISNPASASPMSAEDHTPLQHFAAHDPSSTQSISHKGWARVLGIMFVENEETGALDLDYGRISSRARQVLEQYLDSLQTVEISNYSRDEQLAYWLNFYNAASFAMVYEDVARQAQKISSPSRNPHRELRVNLKSLMTKASGPWHDKQITVEGQHISLADIEHRIVHAFWPEPWSLYGLSCPARGCPALMPQAYSAATLESQLQASARNYVSGSEAFKVKKGKIKPSALYSQHTNFFPDSSAILAHLRLVGGPSIEAQLTGINNTSGEMFSWKLNGKMPPADLNVPQGMFQRGSGASYY